MPARERPTPVLEPRATIGILGGGQLGRMLALAAARLGFKLPRLRARSRLARLRCRAPGDLRRLHRHRSARPLRRRGRRRHLRVRERAGARPRRFWPRASRCCPIRRSWRPRRTGSRRRTSSPASASRPPPLPRSAPARAGGGARRIGRPAVLKTRRFGYDGKGQATIRNGTDVGGRLARGRRPAGILEAFVPFEREVSVVAARGARRRRRMLRRHRERASRPYPEDLARAGSACRQRPRSEARRHRRDDRAQIRLCRRAGGRDVRAARRRRACWSTRSRRGCTIPAIGRSTARRCRNSSSISGRWPAGRWDQADPPRPRRDDQLDRRRGRGLSQRWLTVPGGASTSTARRRAARPQDGPRDARFRRRMSWKRPALVDFPVMFCYDAGANWHRFSARIAANPFP